MVDQLNGFSSEVTRVAREVGTEGKLGGQAAVPGVAGTWKDLTDSVNSMASNLTGQVRNIADVTTAVARGDLSRKITVDVKGEILALKNTIAKEWETVEGAARADLFVRTDRADGRLPAGLALVGPVRSSQACRHQHLHVRRADLRDDLCDQCHRTDRASFRHGHCAGLGNSKRHRVDHRIQPRAAACDLRPGNLLRVLAGLRRSRRGRSLGDPEYGWRSMLWIGAAAPLIVAMLALVFLPESLDFLIRTKARPESVWRVVRRVDRALPVQGPTQFVTDVVEQRSAVGSLFSSGRGAGTLVIWIVFMLNLAEFYALQSWLPSILSNVGYSLSTVALATTMTTVGGIVAAFAIGPAMDRIGPYRSLATVYFSGVLFVVLFGFSIGGPSWLLLVTAFCAGFCISGGQKSVIALAAIYYPTPIRSTGVGWALGIGRLGGIGGPLLIGALLAYHLSAQHILYAAGVPMLLAGLLVTVLGRWYRSGSISLD